ncbi:phage holin family protein [Specibacter sp. NPDC057265]|uniref:phage holin family protein n=1 Tax=Specibacter sp. NPDC057265 TaxID=3346075 RepID=UPI00363317A3
MRRIVLHISVNALALWVASWILPGFRIDGATILESDVAGIAGSAGIANTVLGYVFIGLVFGVVNALVKPVVRFLSLPVTVLTLGLFTIVINAAMLWLTAWVSTFTPVQFTIADFFWTAILAALIISVVSMVVGGVGGSKPRR